MAYDKVVDSAKLDGALNETARAILAKTGEATAIPWDEATGFADAVSDISTFSPPESEYLDPDEVYRTTRPKDWLPMPTPGDDEIYLLGLLTEGIDNKFSIRLRYSGTCTVEIGTVANGEFVAKRTLSVASNTPFTYVVPWDEYGDTTAEGYRQFMIKCKGNFTYASISKDKAGISNVVDCVIGVPNLWFGAGHPGDAAMANGCLRYLRFVGNGYPQVTSEIGGYCYSCLCVSCEKQITSNQYSYYSFAYTPQLIAISPEILFANGDATGMFWGTGLRRIPTENIHPTALTHFNRGASTVYIDGSTFGNAKNWAYCFYSNRALKEVVNLDITSATNFEGAFGYCSAIEKLTFAGETAVGGYTIDLSHCELSHTALVNMIASLPTATNAATITITNNPGAAELTADEIAVATAKNWTITI